MRLWKLVGFAALISLPAAAGAATLYVDGSGTNPFPPFVDWSTAATNIQSALDVAANGDTVVVTDGLYVVSKQVSVTNAVLLTSVNGPGATIIDGNYPTGMTRCLLVRNSAAHISGFTLQNGFASDGMGGGVFVDGGLIENCRLIGNISYSVCTGCLATAYGGGAYVQGNGLVVNCEIASNRVTADAPTFFIAHFSYPRGTAHAGGGGVYLAPGSSIQSSRIYGNRAEAFGGRGYYDGGQAWSFGGGVLGGTIERCLIRNNEVMGRGVRPFFPYNYPPEYRSADVRPYGGGICESRAISSLVVANVALGVNIDTFNYYGTNNVGYGGGAYSSMVWGCTVGVNTSMAAGGVAECIISNSIVMGNVLFGADISGSNFVASTMEFTCSDPSPPGQGNVDVDPLFVDLSTGNFRLAPGSPCIDSAALSAPPVDLDNHPVPLDGDGDSIARADLGAYEYAPAGSPCTTTISRSISVFDHRGALSQLDVATISGCVWTASSLSPWLQVSSGTGGVVGDTVLFTVASNELTSTRTGMLAVADTTHVVIQRGVPCPLTSWTISPTNFSQAGGVGTGRVVVAQGCAWEVTSTADWVRIWNSSIGYESGEFRFEVSPSDLSLPRSTVMSAGGQAQAIVQSGKECPESIYPSGVYFRWRGGETGVAVSAAVDCVWTASTDDAWISLSNGVYVGTGSQTMIYHVLTNDTDQFRYGYVRINSTGQLVYQSFPPCTGASLTPGRLDLAAGEGTGSVQVTADVACEWTAMTDSSWISLPGGWATGSAVLAYNVASNDAFVARTGHVVVAQVTQEVVQAGQPCIFQLAPTNLVLQSGPTSRWIQVGGATECVWTAASSAEWITVTSNTGNGPGAFFFSVTRNGTHYSRTGGVDVAGARVDIVQMPNPGALSSRLDFDADTITDLAVYWPDGGNWYIRKSDDGQLRLQNWGGPGFIPAPGDYDGDLVADIAVYQPSSGDWYVLQSRAMSLWLQNWGWSAASPAPGDYDGDGKTDLAVYFADQGQWFIRDSSSGNQQVFQWGWNATIPVPGDYDGDGVTDVAVYWPAGGVWYIRQTAHANALLEVQWGWSAAVPEPADYDGDGKTDIAVYWPDQGRWYIYLSSNLTLRESQWGWNESLPVPGDYDGDGQSDLTVYWPLPGMWYIQSSAAGNALMEQQWGWSDALPVHPQYWINRWFGLQK